LPGAAQAAEQAPFWGARKRLADLARGGAEDVEPLRGDGLLLTASCCSPSCT